MFNLMRGFRVGLVGGKENRKEKKVCHRGEEN